MRGFATRVPIVPRRPGRLPATPRGATPEAMQDVGRFLVVLGAVAILAGLVLMFAPRIPWLGRLPGDIVINRGPVTVYFPLVTSIVISVVLTLVLNLFWRR